jgi:hypothetical protein
MPNGLGDAASDSSVDRVAVVARPFVTPQVLAVAVANLGGKVQLLFVLNCLSLAAVAKHLLQIPRRSLKAL